MLCGNKIRELRDEQVIKLAELLHQDENEMLKLWLADKVIDAVGDEHDQILKRHAIEVAQKTIL